MRVNLLFDNLMVDRNLFLRNERSSSTEISLCDRSMRFNFSNPEKSFIVMFVSLL